MALKFRMYTNPDKNNHLTKFEEVAVIYDVVVTSYLSEGVVI